MQDKLLIDFDIYFDIEGFKVMGLRCNKNIKHLYTIGADEMQNKPLGADSN